MTQPAFSTDLSRLIHPRSIALVGASERPQSIGGRTLSNLLDHSQIDGELYLVVERGPASTVPWLAFIAGVAGVLVVGASAICLGLSRVERRLDDTTLAAVGGTTRVRRRINALQGASISGGGSVVGALIGVAPALAVTLFSSSWRAEDVPWPPIAGLALALPLLIAAASWIARPHNPNLVRRTAVS